MCRDSHRTSCLCHTVCPCKCSPIRKTQVHIHAHYTYATHKIHAYQLKFVHTLTHTQVSLFRSYLHFFECISHGLLILHANFYAISRGVFAVILHNMKCGGTRQSHCSCWCSQFPSRDPAAWKRALEKRVRSIERWSFRPLHMRIRTEIYHRWCLSCHPRHET